MLETSICWGGSIDTSGDDFNLTITGNSNLVMTNSSDFTSDGFRGNLSVSISGNITATPGNFNADRNVFVTAGGNINLGANSGVFTFASGGEDGEIRFTAGKNITLQGTTYFENDGAGPTNFFAGGSISILDTTNIVRYFPLGPLATFDGQTNFIVDNQNPNPPGIGSGSFLLAPGALILGYDPFAPPFPNPPGPIKIFTARQDLNSIQGNLNGATYTPGPEFINTATEIWGVYFPHNSGIPFTIFYKNISIAPNVIPEFNNAVFEYLQNLQRVDDFNYAAKPFLIKKGQARILCPEVHQIHQKNLIF